ncbi:rod shape-determining protein MreC [Peristeroidobacter soli]|uniref:rod shape-determining protein MreC n=1 Tax=Peristeroidobacter soli TaxID=2497877 RepID=UPI00101B7CE7|nr:rod shape-determining protein MreC [Peristeroidobacter soli]
MVTLSSDSRNIIGRGPPLGAGLFFLGIVSVGMMMLDHRSNYLETVRQWLGAAASPVYAVVQTPGQAWDWLTGSFADRGRLRTENSELSEQLREARVKLLQFDSLREENVRLRAVREASAGVGGRTMIAEIMRVDVDPFRHRVRINKGADDGVFKNQPVLDAFGIVGQVVQVDKYTSTIILISDAEHAIPVQVNRNGIRSIAVGAGDLGKLSLPYMTVESDVKVEDLLVSSGLDGIFPAGYPVARVSKVERNPADTFALVEAKPLAQLDRDREVLLLWDDTPQVEAPGAKPKPATESKPAAEASTAPTPPAQATSGQPAPAAQAPAPTPGAQPLPQPQPPTED